MRSSKALPAGRPSSQEASDEASGRPSFLRKPAMRNALIAAIIVVLGAAGYWMYSNRPIAVQTATVEQDVSIRIFGLGTVEARIRSEVGFEVGATLVELHADHGNTVKKGAVLARLGTAEQEAKHAKAEAALISTQANVNKAKAIVDRARAVYAQRQVANKRTQGLVRRNIATKEAGEEAQRERDVARADVSVANSESEVASALVADARALLRFEQVMLRHRTLVAPYDGVVVERHKELGSVVKPGDPIFTLIAIGSYWGLAFVDEARAGYIKTGQRVEARLRSRPQQAFTGRVVRIGLESDRITEERRVFVAGDNPPSTVILGEQVEFWITVAQLDRALLVPESAVLGYDGVQGRIWTIESGVLQQRSVQFRHRTEDARLEITDGLPDGAVAVVRLESGFREGRAARSVAK